MIAHFQMKEALVHCANFGGAAGIIHIRAKDDVLALFQHLLRQAHGLDNFAAAAVYRNGPAAAHNAAYRAGNQLGAHKGKRFGHAEPLGKGIAIILRKTCFCVAKNL